MSQSHIRLMDIAHKWRDALIADSTLHAWVHTKFGATKTMTYFVGDHLQDPPGETDAPFVAIVPIRESTGLLADTCVWSLSIELGLVDATSPKSNTVSGAYEMKGLAMVEEMRGLVADIIEANSGNLDVNISGYEPFSDFFPLHQAILNIDLTHPSLVGAEITL